MGSPPRAAAGASCFPSVDPPPSWTSSAPAPAGGEVRSCCIVCGIRLSHLDLDSDSESDDGQPSPHCRRRKLFPPSRSTSILDIFSPSASRRRGAILLHCLPLCCPAAVLQQAQAVFPAQQIHLHSGHFSPSVSWRRGAILLRCLPKNLRQECCTAVSPQQIYLPPGHLQPQRQLALEMRCDPAASSATSLSELQAQASPPQQIYLHPGHLQAQLKTRCAPAAFTHCCTAAVLQQIYLHPGHLPAQR